MIQSAPTRIWDRWHPAATGCDGLRGRRGVTSPVGAGKAATCTSQPRLAGQVQLQPQHNLQQVSGVLSGGIFSTPAYFNGAVYYGPVGAPSCSSRQECATLERGVIDQRPILSAIPGLRRRYPRTASSDGIIWATKTPPRRTACLPMPAVSVTSSITAPSARRDHSAPATSSSRDDADVKCSWGSRAALPCSAC